MLLYLYFCHRTYIDYSDCVEVYSRHEQWHNYQKIHADWHWKIFNKVQKGHKIYSL